MNKSAKTPRAPGRPTAADTVQREQLLSIATDLFAQQGIQATRLRAIAERAGVTPALLNYYFGSKERLVEAMVEERFLPLVARAAAQLQQAGDDPLALVEAFIRDMVRNVTEQPWLSQLWVREILCEGGVLRERLMHRVAPKSDAVVAEKFAAAQAAGLTPILCVGETLEEREGGITEQVVGRQLDAVIAKCGVSALAKAVLAYEPVWAIGTGKTASPAQAQAVHACLRAQLAQATSSAADIPLLYGGSVKPDNAVELFSQPDINGGLIGGAALKAADFAAIARAA